MIVQQSNIALGDTFSYDKAVIFIPRNTKVPAFANRFTTAFYDLKAQEILFENPVKDMPYLIYAPSLVGTWMLYQSSWKNDAHAKLLTDSTAFIDKYSQAFIKMRLKFEKFRLGSDVPSPFITRILQKEGYYPLLKSVNIGEWLACMRTIKAYDDRVIII